ncbi:hypothetical protein ACF068_14730 [Streptomyces sp. NPDC016309]|uniref:hypothetical protein n=1 Tax=Streptomyces sp. NPDC016309 TaxID=3364965 RepID=UPI003702B3D8
MTMSRGAMAAKRVIDEAWQHGTAYDLSSQAAFALESAGLLQSPEAAVETARLRARVAELDGLLVRVRDLLPRDRCITEGLPNDLAAARAEYGAWELVAEVLGVPLPYMPAPEPIPYALTGAAALVAPLEDPHESPLHHDYRTPRDLPQMAAEMLADRYPTKGAS